MTQETNNSTESRDSPPSDKRCGDKRTTGDKEKDVETTDEPTVRKSRMITNPEYPQSKYFDYLLSINSYLEIPLNFSEVQFSTDKEKWLQAFECEIKSLDKNNPLR